LFAVLSLLCWQHVDEENTTQSRWFEDKKKNYTYTVSSLEQIKCCKKEKENTMGLLVQIA
jgi:hypothetical protein